MTDPPRERSTGHTTPADGPGGKTDRDQHASRTSGTNRDFDESGESRNQGHSHPRKEGPGDSGSNSADR